MQSRINPWLVFTVIGINVFMATLDGSAVNLVLSQIAHNFGTPTLPLPLTSVGWVSTIYLLMISVFLLPAGAIASKLGERKIYRIGILIFTLSSVLCALSHSLMTLILARALQGFGAALTSALGSGFVAHAFPESKRGMSLGMIGTVVAAGSLTGPIFGGIVATHFGWSAIFWINLPLGIVSLVLSSLWLEKEDFRPADGKPFDYWGAVLSGSALFLFLLTLSESSSEGKLLFALGLVGTLVMAISFLRLEHKIDHPMLPLTIFKNRQFSTNTVFGVINTAASIQALLTLPFFFVEVKNFDMKTTGMFMTVWPLSLALVAPIAGRIADRHGSRIPMLAGPLVQAVGLVLLGLVQMDSSNHYLILGIAVTGVGGSIFVPANNKSLLTSVPRQFLFLASSIMSLIRNVGMVTGIALSAAIVQFMRQYAAVPTSPEGFLYGMHWSMAIAATLSVIAGIGAYRGMGKEM